MIARFASRLAFVSDEAVVTSVACARHRHTRVDGQIGDRSDDPVSETTSCASRAAVDDDRASDPRAT
jgi:hypothetical protein